MAEPSEAELVQKVSQGDRQAYARLLTAQLGSISHYVYRMTTDSAEAEDITQEVFLRLWTHAASFDPSKSKLTTWLHNVAHNLCIDHFRKNGRLVLGDADLDVEGGDEPDSTLYAEVTASRVGCAMMSLPERQRSAIVMCHYQGRSNKEAADILGVSVDGLESLLSRGRRKLKSILTKEGDGNE